MSWSEINFTQKRFSLPKLTETKEESLTATCSSWRNQKKQVVSGFKTPFCRLDSLIHSSFKSIIHYPIAKSKLVSGFKTSLCTDAFWKTKLLKNQISVCLWVWILLFRAHFWLSLGTKLCPRFHCGWFFYARKTTFYLQRFDITNDTTKDKNINISSLWNRILKTWDTLFEAFLNRRKWKHNGTKIIWYFFVTCSWSLGKEYCLGTKKVTPKINIKYFFRDIRSVNNPIQTAAFFEIFERFCIILAQTFWLWR